MTRDHITHKWPRTPYDPNSDDNVEAQEYLLGALEDKPELSDLLADLARLGGPTIGLPSPVAQLGCPQPPAIL